MKFLKIFIYILILHFTQFGFSQATIHHSMIGSQGVNAELSNGYKVYQSIGQQTVTNTGTSKEFLQQGFQQSYWKSIISRNTKTEIISTQLYPNPFTDFIFIKFSKSPGKTVEYKIYDLQGRLIFTEKKENTNNLIKIDLRKLNNSQFLIRFTGDNYVYSNMIIKN